MPLAMMRPEKPPGPSALAVGADVIWQYGSNQKVRLPNPKSYGKLYATTSSLNTIKGF